MIKQRAAQTSLDPRVKLAWLGVLILALFSFIEPVLQFSLAGLLVGLALLGTILGHFEFGKFIGGLRTLAGMLVVVVILQGFLQPGDQVLFQFELLSFPLRFKLEGMVFGMMIAARFVTISFGFMMFFMTTSAYELSIGLYKLRIPFKYAYLISMALDRLPRTVGVMREIESAQGARGHDIERGGVLQKFRNVLPIMIPLVIISLREADQLAIALELRGFGSTRSPTFYHDQPFSQLDQALTGLAGVAGVLALGMKVLQIIQSL